MQPAKQRFLRVMPPKDTSMLKAMDEMFSSALVSVCSTSIYLQDGEQHGAEPSTLLFHLYVYVTWFDLENVPRFLLVLRGGATLTYMLHW